MLKTQEFLHKHGLEALKEQFSIKTTEHEDGRIILNYSQIDSPKFHPIVRECRGLTLDKKDWSLVARSFSRFYNLGESEEDEKNFNFNSFSVQEKVDGSLILLYYWKDRWYVNTRGSFGYGEIDDTGITWREVFDKAFDQFRSLQDDITYVCELCSPYNKVVRYYPEPLLYSLTAFSGEHEVAVETYMIGSIGGKGFEYPKKYNFSNTDEIKDYITEVSKNDPTFEGVVIVDDKNNRIKIKSPKYIALSKIRGEGSGNLFSPKNLLPFILDGESDELFTYYPETEPYFRKYEAELDNELSKLTNIWNEAKSIKDQKEFALYIQGRSKFVSVLFQARKNECEPKTIWRQSENLLLKHLKEKF